MHQIIFFCFCFTTIAVLLFFIHCVVVFSRSLSSSQNLFNSKHINHNHHRSLHGNGVNFANQSFSLSASPDDDAVTPSNDDDRKIIYSFLDVLRGNKKGDDGKPLSGIDQSSIKLNACENRYFCEMARLGSHPNADNVFNKMLWKIANE